ncbi:MAG: ATP-binding protein [Bacillota bacterium]
MKRTLFGKLFIIIAATLIVTFIMMGIALFAYLQQTLTESKVSELKLTADDVGNIYNEYIGEGANIIVENIFQNYLLRTEQKTGASILIVDTNGRVLSRTTSSGAANSVILSQIDQTVKKGEYIQTTGEVITVAVLKPVTVEGLSGKFIVYSFAKMPDIYSTRQNAINMYIIWGAIAIFVVLLSLYFITRRITRPIKEMSLATVKMARGEMGQRVSENSKDEIGELAKSFNEMALALENLESMRRDFVANVSHELRTPMTSMRGFIDAILDGTVEPEKKDYYLKIVREETIRLSRLVDDLLDLTSMQSGKMHLIQTSVDLNEITRRSIIKLEALIIGKQISFEANFDDRDCKVLGDSDMLERVLINLISNAIKFTPEKGSISVNTHLTQDKVFVSVTDNGKGMSQEEINQVFERFYKAEKSRSTVFSGTGLGLSIAKEIINMHGGEISVVSEIGKGSKFEFWIRK